MGKLATHEGTVSSPVPHPSVVRHPFPNSQLAAGLFCPHIWRKEGPEPIKEGMLEVAVSTQGNMVPFAHRQLATVQMVLHTHTHTRDHRTSLQSIDRCRVQHAEQRENQTWFLCELCICEEAAVNTWLRAKRLSAVHAFMARGYQFPKGLQINYTNEESGERKAVLENWE